MRGVGASDLTTRPEALDEKIVYTLRFQELLALGHVKLFVSHCGATSSNEAVYYGVPILCLHVIGDQTTIGDNLASRLIPIEFFGTVETNESGRRIFR